MDKKTYGIELIERSHAEVGCVDALGRLLGALQLAGPHLHTLDAGGVGSKVLRQGSRILPAPRGQVRIPADAAQHVVLTLAVLKVPTTNRNTDFGNWMTNDYNVKGG